MLSNPKRTTPADVMSLDTLIGWLETMPANENYRFMCLGGGCIFSQYLRAHGIRWADADGWAGREWKEWHYAPRGYIAGDKPYTFGAALDRARKLRDAS